MCSHLPVVPPQEPLPFGPQRIIQYRCNHAGKEGKQRQAKSACSAPCSPCCAVAARWRSAIGPGVSGVPCCCSCRATTALWAASVARLTRRRCAADAVAAPCYCPAPSGLRPAILQRLVASADVAGSAAVQAPPSVWHYAFHGGFGQGACVWSGGARGVPAPTDA